MHTVRMCPSSLFMCLSPYSVIICSLVAVLLLLPPCLSCCRNKLNSSIRDYNLYHDNAMYHLKQNKLSSETVFDGVLKIFWGMKKAITLLPKPVHPKRQSLIRNFMYGSCVELSDDPGKQVL